MRQAKVGVIWIWKGVLLGAVPLAAMSGQVEVAARIVTPAVGLESVPLMPVMLENPPAVRLTVRSMISPGSQTPLTLDGGSVHRSVESTEPRNSVGPEGAPLARIIQLPGSPKLSMIPMVAVGRTGGSPGLPASKPTQERPCVAVWSMAAGNCPAATDPRLTARTSTSPAAVMGIVGDSG